MAAEIPACVVHRLTLGTQAPGDCVAKHKVLTAACLVGLSSSGAIPRLSGTVQKSLNLGAAAAGAPGAAKVSSVGSDSEGLDTPIDVYLDFHCF